MAEALVKIRAIAGIAMQETLRRKVLYIIAFLIVAAITVVGSSMAILRMARQAGETQAAASISAGFVQTVLGLWTEGGMALAVFLGAVGISSEITAKTIVNVLSRPVERSAYLTGRWMGTLAFLAAFQIVGIVLVLLIGTIFEVHYNTTLWFGFVEMFVDILFLSGVSLSLSVIMPAVPAGACAIILSILPSVVEGLSKNPRWFLKLPALGLYYLAPAAMPVDLFSESFSMELLHPNYSLYSQVLLENLLYTLVVFVLACAVFSRKELRLR